jgi:hypothetical protein
MASFYQYPQGVYAAEQPLWMNFFAAPYSLINRERTRPGVVSRAEFHIKLQMPKEPGYNVQHEFGESNSNPVGPILTKAGLANSGGLSNMLERMAAPAMAYYERVFATSTFRRFSNIAEMSMVSEGRKQYFFQYIFVPKNEYESTVVEEICGTFRKCSYPAVASGLPERSYPQKLWVLGVSRGNATTNWSNANLTANWLGEPLVCVLNTVMVKRNDDADSIIRYLPNGASSVTLLGLQFTEFETGTYVPSANAIWSKSEISYNSFGSSG